jgi:hypothetical protein
MGGGTTGATASFISPMGAVGERCPGVSIEIRVGAAWVRAAPNRTARVVNLISLREGAARGRDWGDMGRKEDGTTPEPR